MQENIIKEIHKLSLENRFEKLTKEKLHKKLLEKKNVIPAYLQRFDIQIFDIKSYEHLLEEIILQEKYSELCEVSEYVPEEHIFVKHTNRKRPKKE